MTQATLTAHPVGPTDGWSIEPASPKRPWMDKLHDGFAYRCLPLVMANQLGWVIRSPLAFEAVWSGGDDPAHLTIDIDCATPEHQRPMVSSHFGGGILTVSLPWLFALERGGSHGDGGRGEVWVGGVPNQWRQGVVPLEGVVETGWSPYTFTMNFKLTDAGRPVWFAAGEPLCLIRPASIASLENVEVRVAPIDADPQRCAGFRQWREQRLAFNADAERTPADWQKNYYKGQYPDGSRAEDVEHRSRIRLSSPEGGDGSV